MNVVFGPDGVDVFKKLTPRMEATHVMEVAQLFLSLVHSWGLDLPLDKVCESQLGLLRPMVSISHRNPFHWAILTDISLLNRFPYRSASSPKVATCRCCCQPGRTT